MSCGLCEANRHVNEMHVIEVLVQYVSTYAMLLDH